jgi:hypothetical protein
MTQVTSADGALEIEPLYERTLKKYRVPGVSPVTVWVVLLPTSTVDE